MKNFLTDPDFSQVELQTMLDLAKSFKSGNLADQMKGKVLTAIFYNPSLRTLLSFQTGMQKLGGICNVLDMTNSRKLEYDFGVTMNADASEHIKEFVQVVASYSDIVAVRKSDFIPDNSNKISDDAMAMSGTEMLNDAFFELLQKYCKKPIINMESNMYHPCQSLADMLTMQEIVGDVKQKKYVLSWTPHPKPLPLATAHSQLITPAIFGMDIVLACPPEFNFSAEMLENVKMKALDAGGNLAVVHDQEEAFYGADFVCGKSWLALEYFGQWDFQSEMREKYAGWKISMEKMALGKNAKFLHCLPVRRNVEVDDAVLDSDCSVVIREAENRMWAQMGLINYLLKK